MQELDTNDIEQISGGVVAAGAILAPVLRTPLPVPPLQGGPIHTPPEA